MKKTVDVSSFCDDEIDLKETYQISDHWTGDQCHKTNMISTFEPLNPL